MTKFYIYLAIAAAMFSTGLGTGVWIQGLVNDSKEKKRVEKEFVQAKVDAAIAVRRTDNVIIAQNESVALEGALRRSVAANRDALIRLSDASKAALEAAGATHAACLDRAAALSEVFGQCSKEYVGLGEKADRHTIDIRALTKSSIGCFASEDQK